MIVVTTAAQSAARDAAAIGAGIPSRALMRVAGAAAATIIERRFADRLARGVTIVAGPGNNGGDAWFVAGALHARGVRVHVIEAMPPRTDDARSEREQVASLIEIGDRDDSSASLVAGDANASLVIDGVLGTGASGAPRGTIADAIARIRALRERGASVVALDLPSGLDATSGDATHALAADLTITFGTVKRGHLLARSRCGDIVVVDIGLGAHAALDDDAPYLIDAEWVRARVPAIPADAHKGTRRRIAIVGGGRGMAGAALLAERAAARSGVGLVRLVMHRDSLPAAQGGAPEAIAATWPQSDADAHELFGEWPHAVLIGPGLGRSDATRRLVERVLTAWRGPTVLDADALNVFENDVASLATLIGDRAALITPHPLELSRLVGVPLDEVLARRFEIGRELARTLGAVVLLKGTPTVLSARDGRVLVSASGAPTLAVGGSGDVLGGIATTLLAQGGDPLEAGACAAWVHGRAGEIAADTLGGVRGATLDDVLAALPHAWRIDARGPAYPALLELSRPWSDSPS